MLMADFWCEALCFNYPKEIGLNIKGFDYLMTSESKGYYKKGQREAIIEKFKDRLEKDPEYLQYIFKGTKNTIDEFDSFMTSGSRSWDVFVEKFLNLVPWYYIPWYITEFNFISDKVVRGLEKYKERIEKITDLNNATMILLFPNKKMGFQEEQKLFYKLVEQTKSGKKINISEYLENFGWMKTFVLVPVEPLNEKELEDKIDAAIKEKSDETYRLQQERKGKDKELVDELEKIFTSDNELNESIKDARYLGWLLTWSVEDSMKTFASGIPWYKEIAKTIGVKYEDWVYLTISEISKSLKARKSVVSEKEILERKKANILYILDGKVEVIFGDKATAIIDSLKQEEKIGIEENVKEIIGKSASPGKVRGKVKICPTAQDSHIVEDGDILVTGMTTPDYVPAMKKAGAIVTDEGGLLCHAAIISRELGKPCVIATKIATKVLKTGDLVEVDADNGIIKKIKS